MLWALDLGALGFGVSCANDSMISVWGLGLRFGGYLENNTSVAQYEGHTGFVAFIISLVMVKLNQQDSNDGLH